MDKMIISPRAVIRNYSAKKTPTDSEQRLGLWIDRFDHSHELKYKSLRLQEKGQYGFVQVISGTGRFYSEPTGWRELDAGDVFFIFPDVPHYYDAVVEWHHRWVIFDGPLSRTFQEMGYLRPESPIRRSVGDLADTIFLRVKENALLDTPLRELANFAVIAELVSKATTHSDGSALPKDRLSQIMGYINENDDCELVPEDIAAEFGISYSNLRRLFKSLTGRSVKQYITQSRISRAKTLLQDTELPPKQIAKMVGYSDYLYFMRVFKKETGITAGDIRRQRR